MSDADQKERELIDEIKKGRWQAASVVSGYVMRRLDRKSADEKSRINDHILRNLAGEDVEVFRPQEEGNPLPGQLTWCVFDATAALKNLEHHLRLIEKNPLPKEIPDSDYVEIVMGTFDATLFVLHERLLKLYRLMKRHGLATEAQKRTADCILKSPDRKSSGKPTASNVRLLTTF